MSHYINTATTMLSRLQTDYQRLEQSLQRLTDSIAAYNPSSTVAEQLLAADAAITEDLDLLTRHQANHAKLRQLRQTAESLENILRTTVQLLADTRREVMAIPTYNEGQNDKTLEVDRLLAYAKFISRTSVPATHRPAPTINGDAEVTKPVLTNGTTPPAQMNGDSKTTENIGVRTLDEQTKRTLDPLAELQFEPWPPYDVIQQGALADIQRLIDAGKDPASVLSASQQAEADRLKAIEEEREKQEEAEAERRRMSIYHGSRGAAQDDVFDPDA